MTIQLTFMKKTSVPKEEVSVTGWIRQIDYPGALISYIYRASQKRMTKELAPFHLGVGHFMILMALYEKEGRSQDELAQSKGFDKTMIAKSIVKLEEGGFISRVIDPGDNRVKRLYLTKKGRNIQNEMVQIGEIFNRILLMDFSRDEADKVIEGLRKIALNASTM
jgi:DNA-binding MarR family transcriptional regulator